MNIFDILRTWVQYCRELESQAVSHVIAALLGSLIGVMFVLYDLMSEIDQEGYDSVAEVFLDCDPGEMFTDTTADGKITELERLRIFLQCET